MCVLLSLILCLLKRLSNSHFLMLFVSVVDHSFSSSSVVSFLYYSQCANCCRSSFFSLTLFLFFSSFHCSTYFSSFFIYILLLLSHSTLSFLYHVFIPISKRRSTRQKHIYVYGNKNKLQLVFF